MSYYILFYETGGGSVTISFSNMDFASPSHYKSAALCFWKT